ncbi:protein PML-like isoform X2 [Ahaetulla prasina]|uniref:protein PML-like isoform X2 n=1 Tax=Ahaetulla prasina TaxID=499056 RepID=UPI00264701FE|nr:protein PML-like isoform X2 [Ahaetulla prasina]
MAGEAPAEPEAPSCQLTVMNEEFQFLLCDRCHAEVPYPKLLPCLHNLCSQCLEGNNPTDLCVICGTPHFHLAEAPETLNNVFFANLQAKFSIYRKVTRSRSPVCDNCKKEAEFWCSTCEEFLCLLCFRSHQRYLKKDSHEARPLKDFQAQSCKDFLSTIRKPNTMFCSKAGHSTQMLSLYCRQCSQSMCAVCALLDSEHMGQHCDISQEIQLRQNELQNMSAELREKKDVYDRNSSSLEELVRNMERLRNETQELIQQKIEEMIQMLREKGEGFLAEVEAHHNHQVQDVKKKLQEMDGVVQRITSSQRLVEKLHIYASGQEVLEMHPFLKKSMMELRRKQPSMAERIEVRNFLETKSQLQNLLERVTRDRDSDSNFPRGSGATTPTPETVPAKPQTEPQENLFGRSSLKREYVEEATNTTGHPKMVKIEPLNNEETLMNKPGTSYGSTGGPYVTGSQRGLRETPEDTLLVAAEEYSNSSDLENDSSMNISSEEEESTDDDDETGASVLPLDINPTSPVGQKMRYPLSKPVDVSLESRIIFFDLKTLRNTLHLAALGEGTTIFRVMISCLENTSGRTSAFGVDEFLQYLSSLQMPILVGYKLWSMDLAALLNALQKINREEVFEASTFGFLDALPLIREKFPEISNYTLKNLDKIYLWGQLDNTNAGNCAKTLKDLCTIFEINNMFQRRPLIPCSSFRCYASLQPLLREKVLSMPSVQTLALHNVSLNILQSVYQNDPEKGLKKLCRCLNTKRRIGEKKIQRLSKIRTYFRNLLSSSQCSSLFGIRSWD